MGMYVPQYYLDLRTLAEARGIPFEKFRTGLGQQEMAVAPPGEDVVTMGTAAALEALEGIHPASIDTIMFATESGIDQSKAAARYLHRLLGLPPTCKAFELKQACCSSTVALFMATSLVRSSPDKRVLVVASDVARYDKASPGEPTQGAGAVAFLVSAEPRLLVLDTPVGSHTEDVMDFWRPNYRETACVDGKYSIRVYLHTLGKSWKRYENEGGHPFEDLHYFCYHLPFTNMASKAHTRLANIAGHGHLAARALRQRVLPGMIYNRRIGNTYTASLYLSLISLLDHAPPGLEGSRVGFFSYGSGSMGAFFSGRILPVDRRQLHPKRHKRMLSRRRELTIEAYDEMRDYVLPCNGSSVRTPKCTVGPFRMAGISGHKRIYESSNIATVRPGGLMRTKTGSSCAA